GADRDQPVAVQFGGDARRGQPDQLDDARDHRRAHARQQGEQEFEDHPGDPDRDESQQAGQQVALEMQRRHGRLGEGGAAAIVKAHGYRTAGVIFSAAGRTIWRTAGESMRGKPDQRRFEMLLREHQGIAFKVAGIYARGVHDREDLIQEIAAQLWRSFGAFDESRAKFTTWMYRVALNVAISHVRSAKRS